MNITLKKITIGLSLVLTCHSVFAQSKSLCSTNEVVLLSCSVQRTNKIVSICVSPQLSTNDGYMYYAYGKRKTSALHFPNVKTHPKGVFHQGHLSFAGNTGGSYISFSKGSSKYSAYSISGSQGFEKQGLLISKPKSNKAYSELRCIQKTVIKDDNAYGLIKGAGLDQDDFINQNGLPRYKRQ